MILVRIQNVSGNCQIRGYEEFFHVDSLDLGADSALDMKDGKEDGGGGAKRDFMVKKNREPEEVKMSRKADFITPTLMALAIKNRTQSESIFSTIDVSFVQLRADAGSAADIKAYLLLRFGGARLVSWSLSGDEKGNPEESFEFKYKQIAIQYRGTEEGRNYRLSTTQTWDFEKNAEWSGAGNFGK